MALDPILDAYQYVGKKHQLFVDNEPRWRFLLDSYLGGEDYRRGAYLTRYVLETDGEYQQRLRNTPLDNQCRSVIQTYVSFLFRDEAERDWADLILDPQLESWLRDTDLEGRSWSSFMKDVSTWSSVFGHCYVLISKPGIQALTLADQLSQDVRPYASLLTPLVVTDWHYARRPNGRYELDYIKYVEDVNGDSVVVREWTPLVIRTWNLDTRQMQASLTLEEPNELGRVPVVVVYNQRGQVRGQGISDISDIADQQRASYNEFSELEQSVRLEGHPSLVVTPDVQVGAGAGAMLVMPENLDSGLKPYMLNVDATPVGDLWSSIRNRRDVIDSMANTGSVRATETRTISGVAMETEFQLLNARLSEKADNLALAEEQIWTLYAQYQGREWSGTIEYPRSFSIRDLGREMAELQAARAAATSAAVLAVVDYKIMELLDEEPEEIVDAIRDFLPGTEAAAETIAVDVQDLPDATVTPHWMRDPVTGELVQVESALVHDRLAARGYQEAERGL